MPWWGWLLLCLGAVSTAGVALRRQIRYAIRVAKALTTDERLPRPLRWALRVALALKVVPFPDLGIDELLLLVAGTLLVTVYRPTLKAVLAEAKQAPDAQPSSPLPQEGDRRSGPAAHSANPADRPVFSAGHATNPADRPTGS